MEHHVPESRGSIKGLSRSIITGIESFLDILHQDIESLKDYDLIKDKLVRLERELVDVDKRYDMVSDQADRAFTDYQTINNSYNEEIQNIKGTSEKSLSRLRNTFVQDFNDVFDGFDIIGKIDGKKIEYTSLFYSLLQDEEISEKIDVRPKGLGGLIGAKKSELEIRRSLLNYKISETQKETNPVVNTEKEKLRGYDSEGFHIEELKKSAQMLEENREEIEHEKDQLKEKIVNLRSKGEEGMMRFRNYENILDLRENYVESFNDVNPHRKNLFVLIEDALQAYEPPEPDLEKRELKEENRTLNKNVKRKEKSILKLKKELKDLYVEYESSQAKLSDHSKEIRRLTSSMKEQNKRIMELENESVEINKKLKSRSDKLSLSQKDLDAALVKAEEYKLKFEKEEKISSEFEEENSDIKIELVKNLDVLVDSQKKLENALKKAGEYKNKSKKSEEKISDLEDENSQINDKLAINLEKLSSNKKKLNAALKKARDYELNVKKEEELRSGLEEDNSKINVKLEKYLETLSSNKKDLDVALKKAERYKSKFKKSEEEISELEKNNSKINAKLEKFTVNQKKLDTALVKAENYRLKIKKEEKQISDLEEEKGKINAQLEKLTEDFESLIQLHVELEHDLKAAKSEIKRQKASYAALEARYNKRPSEPTVKTAGKRSIKTLSGKTEDEERIVSEKIQALRKRETG